MLPQHRKGRKVRSYASHDNASPCTDAACLACCLHLAAGVARYAFKTASAFASSSAHARTTPCLSHLCPCLPCTQRMLRSLARTHSQVLAGLAGTGWSGAASRELPADGLGTGRLTDLLLCPPCCRYNFQLLWNAIRFQSSKAGLPNHTRPETCLVGILVSKHARACCCSSGTSPMRGARRMFAMLLHPRHEPALRPAHCCVPVLHCNTAALLVVCVCARARACVRARVRVCVRIGVSPPPVPLSLCLWTERAVLRCWASAKDLLLFHAIDTWSHLCCCWCHGCSGYNTETEYASSWSWHSSLEGRCISSHIWKIRHRLVRLRVPSEWETRARTLIHTHTRTHARMCYMYRCCRLASQVSRVNATCTLSSSSGVVNGAASARWLLVCVLMVCTDGVLLLSCVVC